MIRAILRTAGRPAVERRHRHVREGDATRANADVGDRANDARARQRQRPALPASSAKAATSASRSAAASNTRCAAARINTDFIDNSAGVDCSDHEVNIKILLDDLQKRAGLTLAERNRLLAHDDRRSRAAGAARQLPAEPGAISMLETRAAERLGEHAHLIRSLELAGALDRALEFLPSDEEIAERRKAGRGLTRPELAIVLAYTKIALHAQLIESDVPEDPYLAHELERYFPRIMQRALRP